MSNKKFSTQIASKPFLSSKGLKNEAISIKKTINSLQRQQRYLAEYLSPADIKILAKAINVLEPYILIYNQAAKENAKLLEERLANWDKQKLERLENIITQDFGIYNDHNLIQECELFIAFLEQTGKYANYMKNALITYNSKPAPAYLQALKKRLADELDESFRLAPRTSTTGF